MEFDEIEHNYYDEDPKLGRLQMVGIKFRIWRQDRRIKKGMPWIENRMLRKRVYSSEHLKNTPAYKRLAYEFGYRAELGRKVDFSWWNTITGWLHDPDIEFWFFLNEELLREYNAEINKKLFYGNGLDPDGPPKLRGINPEEFE